MIYFCETQIENSLNGKKNCKKTTRKIFNLFASKKKQIITI